MNKGRAVYWIGKSKLKKGEVNISDIKEGEALIEVKYCGICGTDIAIYNGLHPRASTPLIMGHEFSGTIKYIKSDLLKEGDRVVINPLISCGKCVPCIDGISYICQNLKLVGIDTNGGFAKYTVVSVDKLYKIPDSLDFKTATLIEPFATGAHVLSRTCPSKDDLIVILGGGPIGIATGLFFKYSGFNNIYVSEISNYRLKMLKKFGFNVINPKEENLQKIIKEVSGSSLVDIVIEATGLAVPSFEMVSLAKVRGKIMLVGISHKPLVVDLMNVVFKELTIKGVRVYSDEDFSESVKFVCNHRDILKDYISVTFDLNNLKEAVAYASDSTKSTKVVIKVV